VTVNLKAFVAGE